MVVEEEEPLQGQSDIKRQIEDRTKRLQSNLDAKRRADEGRQAAEEREANEEQALRREQEEADNREQEIKAGALPCRTNFSPTVFTPCRKCRQ